MALILGIDVETTGFDEKTDEIIEVGMVLWHWDKKKPVLMANHLINPSIGIPDEITELTGIDGLYWLQNGEGVC